MRNRMQGEARRSEYIEELKKKAEEGRGQYVSAMPKRSRYTTPRSATYVLGIVSKEGDVVIEDGRKKLLNVGKRYMEFGRNGTMVTHRWVDGDIQLDQYENYAFGKGVFIMLHDIPKLADRYLKFFK
ncbi:MAG: hypothetical protein V1887_00825 [Candidatus Aenigmatarchaeota archaeon]